MSPLAIILSQLATTVAVVAFYHLWVTAPKQPSPPPAPNPAPVAVPVPAPAAPAPKPAPVLEPAPETLAVIAAAIAVVLGGPHRVLAVQQDSPPALEVSFWSMEGRLDHFRSHRIR